MTVTYFSRSQVAILDSHLWMITLNQSRFYMAWLDTPRFLVLCWCTLYLFIASALIYFSRTRAAILDFYFWLITVQDIVQNLLADVSQQKKIGIIHQWRWPTFQGHKQISLQPFKIYKLSHLHFGIAFMVCRIVKNKTWVLWPLATFLVYYYAILNLPSLMFGSSWYCQGDFPKHKLEVSVLIIFVHFSDPSKKKGGLCSMLWW